MNIVEMQKELLNSMYIIANKVMKSCSYNYFIEGKVISVDSSNRKCVCKINDQNITLPYRQGLTLAENNIVLIMIPNGVFENKYVDTIRPY